MMRNLLGPGEPRPRTGLVDARYGEPPWPQFDRWESYRQPAPPQPASGGLIDYGYLFARHKWLIAAFMLTGLACGYVLKVLQTPVYRARTTIQIEDLNDNVLGKRDLERSAESTTADSYVQTQIKLLESDTLMEKVLRSLGFP